MSTSTDHQLMLAVRDGDIDQLGFLFERHQKKLYNFFLQQTGIRETSEDLVQDVFLRILKYRHTYRGEGQFTTWLFSIAHNARIDHYRKNRHLHQPLDRAIDSFSEEPTPEDTVKRNDEISTLQKALSKLSDEKREVLLLSRFENMRYEDIAKVMECKVGTVKARVFRALRELAQIYSEISGVKKSWNAKESTSPSRTM